MARLEWRISRGTYLRFRDLQEQLERAEDDSRGALEDDIRSLPNFPYWNDPDRDVIVPVITSERISLC